MEKDSRDRDHRDSRDSRDNRDNRDSRDSGSRDSGRKGRSKYRTEYSGDHVFDYKDPSSLTRFVTDAGRITPARISKLSVAQQKKVSNAVKKSRSLSLLPSGTDAYDNFGRSELISPVPFEY